MSQLVALTPQLVRPVKQGEHSATWLAFFVAKRENPTNPLGFVERQRYSW
jgi:hypothetical protein